MIRFSAPDRIWSEEEVKAKQTDPKIREEGLQAIGLPFRLGTAVALLSALESVRKDSIPGLNIPFCVAHGDDDGGVPIEGTEDYLLAKSSTKAEDKMFLKAQGKHDLMAEPMGEEYLNKIISWMNERESKKVFF